MRFKNKTADYVHQKYRNHEDLDIEALVSLLRFKSKCLAFHDPELGNPVLIRFGTSRTHVFSPKGSIL